MTVVRLLGHLIGYGFYTWASREICPMHDDVPEVVLSLRKHHEALQRAGIFA